MSDLIPPKLPDPPRPLVNAPQGMRPVDPALTLQIQPQESPASGTALTAATANTPAWLAAQIRQNLPQSLPLSSTLGSWLDKLHPQSEDGVALSALTRTLIESLLGHLTNTSDLLDPKRLADALRGSGLWLEARLAQAAMQHSPTDDLTSDLKGRLLRLADQIRAANQGQPPTQQPEPRDPTGAPTPAITSPPLVREIEGMIKHIVTQQLQALETNSDEPRWVIELPVQTPCGVLALEADIRREGHVARESQQRWSMQIRLQLPRLGPLAIRLTLHGDRLSAGIQADTQTGAEILQKHLDLLRHQLEARDLPIASLHAGRGTAAAPPHRRPPILNEQA